MLKLIRDLDEDELKLVLAVKQREEETLRERFQVFWQERCGNLGFLPEYELYRILSNFALNKFERAERSYILEEIKRLTFWDTCKSFRLEEINDLILSAIFSMRLYEVGVEMVAEPKEEITKDIFNEWAEICNNRTCTSCSMGEFYNGFDIDCKEFFQLYPDFASTVIRKLNKFDKEKK